MKHATEDGHIYAKELKHFLRELSASGKVKRDSTITVKDRDFL